MKNVALLLLVLLPFALGACKAKAENPETEQKICVDSADVEKNSHNQKKTESKLISLAFVGDVMMGTNFPDSSYITKDRGRSLFVDCKSIIREANLAIANLEGTMYYGTQGTTRKSTNSATCFIFRMPGDHAQHLVDAGFDAVGIANNHSNDFGQVGRKLTLQNIKNVGLGVSGIKGMAEECIIERDGITYGFLQFAASCTNTLDLNSESDIDFYISRIRKKCDILIVTFHGGAEGSAHTHVPFTTEYFVGEKRGDVAKFARRAVDKGADIVIGHGPHVPRAMELYKGHLIAYSLGNFCTPYRMNLAGVSGYAPLLVATINSGDGTFDSGKIHSFKQQKGVGPRLDTANSAAQLIRNLTLSDFPKSGLDISESGNISVKE